jgi:lipoprotein-anchoring transpeptidase ErfK/SrfK
MSTEFLRYLQSINQSVSRFVGTVVVAASVAPCLGIGTALSQPVVQSTSVIQVHPPSGLPSAKTVNFVPQGVLDAANRIPQVTVPALPGLGIDDLFLPDLDPLSRVHLQLKLGERRVYVYDRDQVATSFPVAIGRAGWETPVGTYKVIQMLHNPVWQHPFTGALVPPGPENPLGARWIGFWTDGTNYIGFHGTPNEETVGRPASHGCVRMYNRDVVRLFEMVRVGTPVEVVP